MVTMVSEIFPGFAPDPAVSFRRKVASSVSVLFDTGIFSVLVFMPKGKVTFAFTGEKSTPAVAVTASAIICTSTVSVRAPSRSTTTSASSSPAVIASLANETVASTSGSSSTMVNMDSEILELVMPSDGSDKMT